MGSKGASLLEVMTALVLIGIISTMAILPVQSLAAQMQAEYVIKEIQQDLHQMQLHAMKTGKEVSFRFYPGGTYTAASEGKVILQKEFDYPVRFQELSLHLHQVVFRPNGNLRNFGQIRVQAAGKAYRLVFQIGRGRFYFAEL
ncbi:prepilin-type N-terminal cleavage/methylation domain-containing protein [Alkalicoccus daliensis]|uniref:Competence protein ComGD n=1 Tax=Alkalicoccus daliensis TaxID=745820 RepID=A0A1H0B6N1_9BACI|nr:prepilin-type N-terminal cleavage/methylation domain-containing protein [Alkalicoccus daliensis]SDN41345.1 competence protein ComGD [Alkalicoccus daliensis]